MAPLGPFGPAPRLGLAVSGGADSLCLAALAAAWARARGGAVIALVVDHRLRAKSGAEADETRRCLSRHLGIRSRLLRLANLSPGPGLSARARAARYAALEQACTEEGLLDLLLGHHAADQAETVLMRGLRGSGAAGLAGMAPLVETQALRLLRPLLPIPPGRLRLTLREAGIPWVEDPSNANPRFTRARLRSLRADRAGAGPASRALVDAAAAQALARAASETEATRFLARSVEIRPEGFALLPAGPWPAPALGALLRMIGGSAYPPDAQATARIASRPVEEIGHGITLAGVRLQPAGRLGPGFLLCREAAAMAPAIPARAGMLWDGRFRLLPGAGGIGAGDHLGPLGMEAARFRKCSPLPAVVLETLACLRAADGRLRWVPALGWGADEDGPPPGLVFSPANPASRASVCPLSRGSACPPPAHPPRCPPARAGLPPCSA